MVMKANINDINLPDTGTTVGCVRPWMNGDRTWDGYLLWEGEPSELVANDTSRVRVEYEVVRRYQGRLMEGLEGTARSMRTLDERRAFSARVARVLECSDAMRRLLKEYYLGGS